MIASDVITLVRGMVKDAVQDSNGNYRWNDPSILAYIGPGQREIVRKHPEAQYVDGVSNPATTNPAATGSTLDINDFFLMPLAYYVASQLLREDADDASNQKLSGEFYTLFLKEME